MDRLTCGLEVKFEADQPSMTVRGYGAVFGNIDAYGDVIQKGAFRRTLDEAKASGNWPAMLSQHGGAGLTADDMMPIGIWTTMREDATGLYVEGKLADTQRGRDAYALLKMERPALNGLSIGFYAKKFTLRTRPDEPRRTLEDVELVEVSLVTRPANTRARITGVKSGSGLGVADAIEALRSAGFSTKEAATITAGGFKSLRSGHPDPVTAAAQRLISAMKG